MNKVTCFGPATVANVGPGFDCLGFALEELGDRVTAKKSSEPGIRITKIRGDGGKLPYDVDKNCAGIAAKETLRLLRQAKDWGAELTLEKGLPIGSGLGSSAASAVAAAYAINRLAEKRLDKRALLPACLKSEATVSGFHADNVAPSMLGGFVLIKNMKPLQVIPLGSLHAYAVVTHPDLSISTKTARAILPRQVALEKMVWNTAHLAGIVTGVCTKNIRLVGESICDAVIEPARKHLIPGFDQVKNAALEAGALGCSISGSGPTVFALTEAKQKGRQIGKAMVEAFAKKKVRAEFKVVGISSKGATTAKDRP
ncbi:MAG TPA: homoserine kinase [Candidatus Diapherotrites archaeon]|uniref:Homoserine kinase n=1 Tax=Candidatus Iainarchaeum sp. TaxID=3101447 RepID=A0A7J4JHX9_9ARCH|nr:homoserine kinase [Candidatus Diapherotrites archaeon]HIH15995.1 homoserine kinase [Candidatus Diapherotrites archaeon]